MEVVELLLESNQPEVVEDLKKKINEQFSLSKCCSIVFYC